jgi:hypothetical protein
VGRLKLPGIVADLQDPPELIPEMVECWRAGAEVVRAQRRTRQERGLPDDAVRCFLKIDIDYLVLGNTICSR